MSVFRVGDRVIRTGVSKNGVVKGNKYTVTSVGNEYMSLGEINPYSCHTDYHYWACNKFKKANKWWKDG